MTFVWIRSMEQFRKMKISAHLWIAEENARWEHMKIENVKFKIHHSIWYDFIMKFNLNNFFYLFLPLLHLKFEIPELILFVHVELIPHIMPLCVKGQRFASSAMKMDVTAAREIIQSFNWLVFLWLFQLF